MVDICFKPCNKAQEGFITAVDGVAAYIGGIGSGKTHVGAADTVIRALRYPQADGLIAANTYTQLETATLPKVFQLLDEWGIPYRYQKAPYKIITIELPGFTGQIHCRSLTEYHDLRGIEILYAWLDETRDTKEDAFKVVLGRLRQRVIKKTCKVIDQQGRELTLQSGDVVPASVDPGAVSQKNLVRNTMRITSTPDLIKAKWLYDYLHDPERAEFLKSRGMQITAFHSSSAENPYLANEYISMLMGSFDEELLRQEVEGEWVIIPPGKPVFGSVFNSKVHCGEYQYNPSKPLLIGIDWGYHSPAALFAQEDTQDRLIVLGEYLGSDLEIGEFCEKIWGFIHKHIVPVGDFSTKYDRGFQERVKLDQNGNQLQIEAWCDPAGKQATDRSSKSSIQLAREYGLYCRYQTTANRVEAIQNGISTIRRRMSTLMGGKPGILINERLCMKLVEGFRGGYHYPDRKDDFTDYKNIPHKDGTYDHIMDALRYLVSGKYTVLTKKMSIDPTRHLNFHSYD